MKKAGTISFLAIIMLFACGKADDRRVVTHRPATCSQAQNHLVTECVKGQDAEQYACQAQICGREAWLFVDISGSYNNYEVPCSHAIEPGDIAFCKRAGAYTENPHPNSVDPNMLANHQEHSQ